MRRVFISNTKVQKSGDIIIDASFNVFNFVEEKHKDGNTTFVIDVHCTFKEAEKMQQQGGVIIYRQLLSKFKDCQDKLKVIFYSPISQKDLVELKPENYVLVLLPFVELFSEMDDKWKLLANWDFENALQEAEKENCPQLNNASENLLSGWALYKTQLDKSKKQGKHLEETDFIKTTYLEDGEVSKRRLVFIDDQIEEWKMTFNNILEQELNPSFLLYNKLGTDTIGFDPGKISNFEKDVKEADLIISDFYLEESHEPNIWMSKEQLEKISGFQLFEKIKGKQNEKGINTGAGYILHSSSNKIPYYRILDANGIDNWLVKDIRTNTSVQEKIENFRNLKNGIEDFTSNDSFGLHKALKNLWARLEKLELTNRWWQANVDYNNDEIFHILKNSWFTLRGFANKQTLFMEKSGVVDINFTPASVISSLGKLNEVFNIQKINGNCFQKYLVQARNAGSHYSDLDQIELIDSLIYFDSWLNALNSASYNDAFMPNKTLGAPPFMIQDTSGKKKNAYKYRLLYLYMQFYNSPYSHIHGNPRKLIRKRVDILLENAVKDVLLNEVLNHVPKDKDDRVITDATKLKDRIAVISIQAATIFSNFFIQDKNDEIFINYK